MDQLVFGRESEVAAIRRWLDGVPARSAALLLQGAAGIGKTTVLRAGMEVARQRAHIVLTAQPTRAEQRLSFSGLADLLEPIPRHVFAGLPPPQKEALEIALLRRAASDRPPDPRTTGAAALSCVRALSATAPVVIAVDDIQWLDAATERILSFLARRLENEPVGLLVARRTAGISLPPPLGLDESAKCELTSLYIEPLGPDAIRVLLRHHLDWRPGRGTLERVVEISGGNPLFALELGRALRGRPEPEPGEPLPVPQRLRDLVLARLRDLPSAYFDVLLRAAALRDPHVELLRAASDDADVVVEALDAAEDASLIERRERRIAFAHPLFASVLYGSTRPSRRRAVHARLAEVVSDPEERARHLALAASGPDTDVAEALDHASHVALARGAPDAAAELADLAAERTPEAHIDALRRRWMAAADHHAYAGNPAKARRLLETVRGSDAPPDTRAGATRRLAEIEFRDRGPAAARLLLEEALATMGPGRTTEHARIHTLLAIRVLTTSDPPEIGAEHAGLAADIARDLGDEQLEAEATAYLVVARFIGGVGFDSELAGRMPRLESMLATRHWHGVLKMLSGDLDGGREWLDALHRQLVELGDETLLVETLYWLTELEWRAGRWDASRNHALTVRELAARGGQGLFRAFVAPYIAAIGAARGDIDRARTTAAEGMAIADASGHVAGQSLNGWALGFTELCAGDPAAAAEVLDPVWELTEEHGYRDPGLFVFHADLIEALIAVDRRERAEEILRLFDERGRSLGRTFAEITSLRCRALLAASQGRLDEALSAGAAATQLLHRLPMPLERGRTWLVHGAHLRRAKKKSAAREALTKSLDEFRELRAESWTRRAEQELDRVAPRPSEPLGLTPTEVRVAEQVVSGATNREIAQALSISVRTVEANLTRIYRKLGVERRADLVRLLTSASQGDSSAPFVQ